MMMAFPHRRYAKPLLAGLVCLALGAGPTGHFAANAQSSDAAKGPQALVAKAAQQIGVKRCLAAINAVSQRGVVGAASQDILLNWDHATPDQAPFFSLTAMGKDAQRAALSITAVPNADDTCAIIVERISSGKDDCAHVAAHDLPPMKGVKLIDGVTVYPNPRDPEETYTLMQNTGSCTVIRRQAIFHWPLRK